MTNPENDTPSEPTITRIYETTFAGPNRAQRRAQKHSARQPGSPRYTALTRDDIVGIFQDHPSQKPVEVSE